MSLPDYLLDEPDDGDVELAPHELYDCPAPGHCVACREHVIDVVADMKYDAMRGK